MEVEKKEEKKLYLLDAYALIFRAYYAFIKNPRMRMLISSFDKMEVTKRENHLITADKFLKQL